MFKKSIICLLSIVIILLISFNVQAICPQFETVLYLDCIDYFSLPVNPLVKQKATLFPDPNISIYYQNYLGVWTEASLNSSLLPGEVYKIESPYPTITYMFGCELIEHRHNCKLGWNYIGGCTDTASTCSCDGDIINIKVYNSLYGWINNPNQKIQPGKAYKIFYEPRIYSTGRVNIIQD